jgi:hypothetical protein
VPDVTVGNAPMHTVLRGGPLIGAFERLLGGDVRAFDYTVRARPGRLSALSVLNRNSILYGAFVPGRRALNGPNRRSPAPRATACLAHYLLTIAKGY